MSFVMVVTLYHCTDLPVVWKLWGAKLVEHLTAVVRLWVCTAADIFCIDFICRSSISIWSSLLGCAG